MHIAEGVLSPAQCAVWYAAAAPFVVHGGYRVVKEVKEHPENKLLLATAALSPLCSRLSNCPALRDRPRTPPEQELGRHCSNRLSWPSWG